MSAYALRAPETADFEALYRIHRAAMGAYVEATWGPWDEAAQRINKTRVTRGGLAPASAADGVAGLTTKLGYEMEIEVLGLGASSYYWRRRTDALLVGTPHEMPVPAKELGVKGEALYTWGGTGAANSVVP